MKLKRFLGAVTAAAMISTAGAAGVYAAEENVAVISASPYSIEYAHTAEGAVVSYVTALQGVTEITIPGKTASGEPVVGIADLAFRDAADLKTVTVPDSLDLDRMGDAAFLRKKDIGDFLISIIPDQDLSKALTYAANQVKFMNRSDWKGDEPELDNARKVMEGIKSTAGIEGEGISIEQGTNLIVRLYFANETGEYPYYVREDGVDDLTKMSARSYSNFRSWVKTIPMDITLKGNENTDGEKYAKGKALLGLKYEAIKSHLTGDANQDGVVNVRDCAKIANAVAFKTVDKLECFTCADYNGDGTVNVRDAAQLANAIAAGKISK